MENNIRMLEVEGAADRAGIYYTCINSYLSAEEAAYIVNDSKSRIVVTSAAKRDVATQLPALCPGVERWLMVDSDAPEAPFEAYEEVVAKYPSEPIADEQLGAAMLYSSGTTGRPKGILRPLPEIHPGTPLPVMDFVKGMFGFREGMHYLSPAPLYHSAPQASLAVALRLGATSVIMERFDPAQYLDLVAKHRITHSQLVPTMFTRMLKLPEDVRRTADVSSLERVVHAAAPCPVPVKEQMIEWWGPIIVEYYGATEAHGFTYCDSEEWLAHKGTVGKAVLGEVLILDDDGSAQPTGQPGTVWFRGATNFEYFNDPEKTAESRDASGDMSSVGDVGYLDEDGYLYLTDRKTYMIISGGVNIYPQETENLLITHPKVMDAAVIGVPNDDLGEEVKAVVQVMEGVETGTDAGAGADRVLQGAPGELQGAAIDRLRSRIAPPTDRQALQAPPAATSTGKATAPGSCDAVNGGRRRRHRCGGDGHVDRARTRETRVRGRPWSTRVPARVRGRRASSSAIIRFSYSTWDGVVTSWESMFHWQDWADHLGAVDDAGMASFFRTGMVVLDYPGNNREAVAGAVRPRRHPVRGVGRRRACSRDCLRSTSRGSGRLGCRRTSCSGEHRASSSGAYFTPDAGFVDDPQLAAHNLMVAAIAHGAVFRFRDAVTVERHCGPVTGVELAGGERLDAPIVVNAAGPHSARVNELAGVLDDFTITTRPLRQEVHVAEAPARVHRRRSAAWSSPTAISARTSVRIPGGTVIVSGVEAECDPMVWVDDPDDFDEYPTAEMWEAHVYRLARRLPALEVPSRPRGSGRALRRHRRLDPDLRPYRARRLLRRHRHERQPVQERADGRRADGGAGRCVRAGPRSRRRAGTGPVPTHRLHDRPRPLLPQAAAERGQQHERVGLTVQAWVQPEPLV